MLHLRHKLLAAALFLTLPLCAVTQTKSAPPAKPSTAATTDKIDINTATVDQLKAFPGIGDAYAKRIVDGRPYTAKNQLLTRGILPEATYNTIKDQIVASHPTK